MAFGFNTKYETATRTMGARTLPRTYAPLVKTGGGGTDGSGTGGSSGGGNEPLGCPKCVSWVWIPLGCVGVLTTLSWILARK
jgi:hypothetical protein